ncbi:hypothetical protein [Chloroflexus sp.]|uniref:hypothetical protein n=1 Tax=Chloroflexus sp. TaxID=1904827 RepID=UPI00258390A3|nr:hypothetical protein [Chloroflexus sp.]
MVLESLWRVNLEAAALFEAAVLATVKSGPQYHQRLTYRTLALIFVPAAWATHCRSFLFNRLE